MAYAAVISLKQTLNRLLNSSRTPLVSSTREILQLAYSQTTILQQALERFSSSSSSERLDVLECEIRDCAHKLEDILDFHEEHDYESELESEITSFTKRAAEMGADYIEQLLRQPVDGDDDDDDGSSNVDVNVKMVGRSSEFINMKWLLIERMRPDEMCLFYIVGAAGTGRTIVAKTVFEDLRGDDRFFDCGAWAAIGATYQVKEVLIDIISQVVDENVRGSECKLVGEEEEKIGEYLYRMLEHRRYMIVLDNVRDVQILHRLMGSLPEQRNGSIVLVATSDLVKMGVFAGAEARRHSYPYIHEMPTAKNEQCSWVPLRMNLFGEVPISPELEEVGKKIAENCGGLRISLAKTLLYLSKTEKTMQEWSRIAADKENPIFMVGDEILEKREIEKELQSYTQVQNEDEDENEDDDESFIHLISKWLNFTDHIQNIKMAMYPKGFFLKIIKYFYGMVGIEKSTLVKEVIKDQDEDEDEENSFIDLISKWLDFSDHVQGIKMKMHPKRFFPKMQIISFYGMAGIGKSTLVKEVIKDDLVSCQFSYCVWVTLGPKYRAEEILIDILAQIHGNLDRKHMKGDEELVKDLCAQLSQKKGLIVLDDIWSKEPLHHLKKIFPDIKGIALVTTRLAKVAIFDGNDTAHQMRLLNKEESWCLLRQQVFGEEGFCCFELETAGRKIAENCEGLPLLIIKVSDQLLKVEKSIENWNNAALGKQNNSVFMNAHDEISKALRPSYLILPQHLKVCFLYLGVFCKGYEIPMFKLTNLLIAEGFLEPNTTRTIKDFVKECLYELVDSSLVMYKLNVSCSKIKTCRLHPVFWHLCNDEAAKNGFFHAINSYDDCSTESINNQRRLCVRNSSLLGMQIVHNSIASIASAHSFLCVGPPHQYQVPINFGLRLLRVMDALTIRLYEFPAEVVKLIHLRYLGLTCNGKLPASISKVWKLQHLIVRRYICTKSTCDDSSLLPVEIWDMQELEHLQIMGGCLPNPKFGAALPKLSTLLDVSAQCCTKKVLKKIPNLKRLGIRIELAPNGKGNPFRCLNQIARLRRLESLKCVVVNPHIGSNGVTPPPPISMFPSSLKTLSLSGLGYPWEHMSIIGQLENLQVLKLKRYAFRGPKWVAGKWDVEYPCEFENLKFLLIEDTDLMHWEIKTPMFVELERISIKHCYKLQELPTYLPISHFVKIEIVDCNPLAVKWAEEMRIRPARFVVESHLSWIAPH